MELLTLISTVICDLDPMGLLAGGAPEDEYEPEIREIGERITPELSAEEIASLMAEVFSRMFSVEEPAEKYLTAAKGVRDALQGKTVFYDTWEEGKVTIIPAVFSAQFVKVMKYLPLYREELPRFRKDPAHIYGLPFYDSPEKEYHGTDRRWERQRWRFFPKKEQKQIGNAYVREYLMPGRPVRDEKFAMSYLQLLHRREDFELIWVRLTGSHEEIPAGYTFFGYDISYPPDFDGGFSMICDCMFICRWHGCDSEGTLFAEDFAKLNRHGLFDRKEDALEYLYKYAKEDWTETGWFGIFEVYGKD
ncbi:MAG: hypothetical protein IJX82_01865 [Clostridia bacterium]|nr:hypothetical protein [Clostridia bacterium]